MSIENSRNNIYTFQKDMVATKVLGVSLQVLNGDGRQTEITDIAAARFLLNRHLRHSSPPLLPAPLSKIANDTSKVVAVLRSLWKHEGFAWGHSSNFYDFMSVSVPIEAFSKDSRHILRKEKKKTFKLSDVITNMEEPTKKPKLSKNYTNLYKREVHVLIIETLMKVMGRDPENYHDSKRLADEFDQSWSHEEETFEGSSKDGLQITPGVSNTRDSSPLTSPASPAAIILASPITPLNKAAVVRPAYYTTGKVGTTVAKS